MLRSVLLLFAIAWLCHGEECAETVIYDSYTATRATDDQLRYYDSVNQRGNCTVAVSLPCDPNEWRRTDGSCNNLNYPSRGTHFNPMYRILPPQFHNGYHARKAVSGNDLPSERKVRLQLLRTGKSRSPNYNLNTPAYGIFMFGDIGSVHDIENYIIYHPYCCEPEHMNDYVCASNILEDDDPWHRYDGIKCLNMTRPIYYQDFECTDDPVPSPIAQQTPAFDMSHIYNNFNDGDSGMRTHVNGRLEVEEEHGKIWPPNGRQSTCIANEGDETRCFKWHRNALLPISLFTIWFIRIHNYVADKLFEVNPCWDDDTLFRTSREICIAWSQQMMLHEWMDALVGHENMVSFGLISDSPGCRYTYDDTCYPKVSVEYSLALRWFHIMQEANGKMYDTKGNFIKDWPIVNGTFRTGFLAVDDNIDYFTQGSFRQPTSNFDSMVDYDIAEQGLGGAQRALDTCTSDLHKNRLFGVASFIDYYYKFTGKNVTCFEDLVTYQIVEQEKVELLKEIYENVADIDLLAGAYVNTRIQGGGISEIIAYILMDNLLQAQKCDRHWYERCDRPHAFTEEQMPEIRKLTLAQMLCAVGDRVTEVQPKAFLNISPENPLTKCSDLPQINFEVFADEACNCD